MNSPSDQRHQPRGVISWREVPWIVALGVSLSLHLWFPRIEVEPLNDTYSAEMGGRNAFFQLTERRASRVSRNLDPLYRVVDRLDVDATLCVIGPARYPTEREWASLLDWVAAGGHLLFAARWDDAQVELPGIDVEVVLKGKVAKKGTEAPDKLAEGNSAGQPEQTPSGEKPDPATTTQPTAEKVAAGPSGDPTVAETEPEAHAKLLGEKQIETNLVAPETIQWESRGVVVIDEDFDAETLLRNKYGPQVVRVPHGVGTIVVCASDEVFSNSALFDRKFQNGVLASRLLSASGTEGAIVFDESLNSSGTPQVVGLLLDPHLRPLTIQALIVLILFGWRGGRRFGGLLPKGAEPRHNLTDHTDALGNLFYKTRNGVGALRAYLEQLKRQLRLHLTTGRDPRALAPIAQRSGIPVEEVQKLLVDAEALAEKDVVKRRSAGSMIRRLSRLRSTGRIAPPRN